MMMKKTTHLFIALLFVGSIMPLVPGGMAQGGSDAVASDATGDVVVTRPAPDGEPEQTDATGPEQVAKPVDLTEVRFYGESPTEMNIGFTVDSFSRSNIQTIGKLDYFVCFQWDGTGDWYQYRASFHYSNGGSPSGEVTPSFNTGYLDRMNEGCSPFSDLGDRVFKYRFPTQLIQTEVDFDAGTVDVRIPRIAFEDAVTESEGEGSGPVPSEGDTISGLQAISVARQGSNYYLLYDEAGGGVSTTLSTDTGNDIIRVSVPQNIQSATVRSTGGVPVYGVEIGSFQTVPITIENGMDEAIQANISFSVVGDAADWDVRVIKSIPVGAAKDVTVDGEPKRVPGSETVTLIVNSAPEIKHKETLRLLITATDDKFPGVLGAALVDVVAVDPPSATKKSVFFHAMGHPCNTAERWLNTLKTDPATNNNEIEVKTCVTGNGEVNSPGAGGGSVRFQPDVPFARDYVYDTTAGTKATIALKSVERVPMNPDQEHDVPVTANVLVQVLAGSQLMGEGRLDAVPIEGGATKVDVPLTFVGTSPGATERTVSADDPLGIRIVVTPAERTFVVCNEQEPCKSLGGEKERPVPASTSGRIFLLTDQSQVDLPIKSSERAGAQLNITASGALITLRLSELDAPTLVFTNPGRVVVYNLSVRNEGVNVDTAKISARVNQTGWNVEVLPVEKYKLGIGEARLFNVRVTAPEDAGEGETAGITIVARSTVDEEAEATLPLLVKVTKGQQFEDQEIDEKLQGVDTEESPSGVLVPSLLLVGLAFVIGRRRRR